MSFNNNQQDYQDFMKNRNGLDALGKLFFYLGIIALGCSIVVPAPYKTYVIIAGVVFIIYTIFRIFSTKFYNRQRENEVFLKIIYGIKNLFTLKKKSKTGYQKSIKIDGDDTRVIVICPYCNKKIRVPNKKGKHGLKCPQCKKDFKVKF